MKTGMCALCGAESTLSHSHIFPEFFYGPTYDESHRYVAVRRDPTIKAKPYQKGLREYRLCETCETTIGCTESYAASLFRDLEDQAPRDGFFHVTPFDYATFKLFGVSLLWRAHLAANGIFAAVRLGPFAEKARRMLLDQDPGLPHELGFTLARITGAKSAPTVIIGPQQLKYHGHRCYHYTALGYRWVHVVSGTASALTGRFPFIGAEPTLSIPALQESEADFIGWLRRALPWMTGSGRRA